MKKYIKPELEVMLIKADDIIQTSALPEAVNGVRTQSVQSMGTVEVKNTEAVDVNGQITMDIFG